MKCLTRTILLLSAVAALGKEGHIEFERSKLIVQDRQLGGAKSSKSDGKAGKHSSSSKSSKPSYIFAKAGKHSSSSKSSKSSYIFAKSSKASHKSSKSSHIQAVPVNSRDSRDINIEEVVTTKTQPLLNGGIAKDYNKAACVSIIATMAVLWN